MATNGVPSYRRQRAKPQDRAFVEFDCSRIYLGVYGSDESRAEYERVIAEWRAGRSGALVEKDEITVIEDPVLEVGVGPFSEHGVVRRASAS